MWLSRRRKEKLRKYFEARERARMAEEKTCDCPNCGHKLEDVGFVFFDDPCFCGSGKMFKDCCYKKAKVLA